MEVLSGHLDWGLGTKGLLSDPADKTFFESVYCQECFYVVKIFVKNGVKTSIAGSCTNTKFLLKTHQVLNSTSKCANALL